MINELRDEFLEQLPLRITPDIEDDDKSLEMIKLISKHTNNIYIFYFDDIDLPFKKHGNTAEIKIFESIKKLHQSIKNLIIVIISSKEAWTRIIETELELKPFNLNEFKVFFLNSMEIYWEKCKLRAPKNLFFPLNENMLDIFFHETKGNPKQYLHLCIKFIEKVANQEISINDIT
jgi:hypothetical protein